MEPRTIILALDGRYVTIGRHSAPTEAEIASIANVLTAQGVCAWLARMHGSAHDKKAPRLEMIRPVTPHAGEWSVAVDAFNASRKGEAAPRKRVYRIKVRDITGPCAGQLTWFPVSATSYAAALKMARRCWPDCEIIG